MARIDPNALETMEREALALEDQASALKDKAAAIRQAFVRQHCPVRVGDVVEDTRRKLRLQVHGISVAGETQADGSTLGVWTLHGPVLNRRNEEHRGYSGLHRITFIDLDGPRNSVKIIRKGLGQALDIRRL